MGVEKIDKRVRETSLRKFITISRQLFVIILSLCTDTGSACYESYSTFPEGMSVKVLQSLYSMLFRRVCVTALYSYKYCYCSDVRI